MSHWSSKTTSFLEREKRLDLEEADMALVNSMFFETDGSGGERGTG